jgi:hypothetical protein
MDKTTNYLTERLVIAVSPEQKRGIHDQAAAAGKGIGEYLREILFPDTTQAELETLQHRMKSGHWKYEIMLAKGSFIRVCKNTEPVPDSPEGDGWKHPRHKSPVRVNARKGQ